MIELYLLSLAFGGVLVGANVVMGSFGGDHDAELDADADVDVDVDADVDADIDADVDAEVEVDKDLSGLVGKDASDLVDTGPWLPLTSLRFWSFFAASFGATGAGLWGIGVGDVGSAAVATPVGLAVGWSAAWLFQWLKRESVSGATTHDHLVGEDAVVLLPVRPGGVGKIRVRTAGGVTDLTAQSADGRVLDVGERVLIAGLVDGRADVTALAPHGPSGGASTAAGAARAMQDQRQA